MALCGGTLPHQRQQQLLMTATHKTYQRPIAPAPLPGSFTAATHYAPHSTVSSVAPSPYTKSTKAPTTLLESANNPSIIRRNARERNRVKQVNNGFSNLRQHLPPAIIADLSNGRRGIGPGAHKKLSKVDTLRMAVEYIRRLQCVIDQVDGRRASAPRTWHSQLSPATSVSSISSAVSSTPSTGPEAVANTNEFFDKMQQHFFYADNFNQQLEHKQQQEQQHSALISPSSSIDSAASYGYSSSTEARPLHIPLKLEYAHNFDDQASNSADEDDILDYITLWQEQM